MTEQLYMDDCYLRECDAAVVRAEGSRVILSRTVFAYRGGGQASDQGKLLRGGKEFAVKEVLKEDGSIWHCLESEGISDGDKVRAVLDWERRYALMRYHTASHVLSAILHREAGALITGNQIEPDRARFDFSLESFDREQIAHYVEVANEELARGHEVRMYNMPREDALKLPGMVKLAGATPPEVEVLRILEIGDVDRQADGGTHVRSTKECGRIELLKFENKGKNNRRLYFRLP